jgi:hypothetical protein
VIIMVRNIGFAAVLAMTATAALAAGPGDGDHQFLRAPQFTPVANSQAAPHAAATTMSAPEVDPASAMAGLTLMLGTLAVLRGGRRATKQLTE